MFGHEFFGLPIFGDSYFGEGPDVAPSMAFITVDPAMAQIVTSVTDPSGIDPSQARIAR